MGYQALYRRYRPARFEDFVGQEDVLRTLRSQVMSGRIAHAYLFCGTRGTGKTSAAKVFARAVNCEHPEQGEPCGQCAACRALTGESAMDILEIDAASNNGVDEIRDLRERVKYPPQTGKYRVYIIDEVHMLSAGAFNALLKTLEEPPSYVIFILATTEPQKLLATILSRCQRFDFRRIPLRQIVARLRVMLEEEGLTAEESALTRIARAAEGGMRDAWSVMDMCLGYAQEEGGALTEALVLRVLGAADRHFLFDFMDKLISTDAAGALSMIDEMMRMGREVQVVARDVSAHIRALMLTRVCGEAAAAELLETTAEDAAEYVAQAGRTSHTRLMRMLDLFLAAETDMKWSAQPRFALEAAALRACAPEEGQSVEALLMRVDELERRLREGGGSGGMSGEVAARLAQLEAQIAQGTAAVPAPETAARVKKAAAPASKPAAEAPEGADPEAQAIWKKAVDSMKKDPPVYFNLRKGRLLSAEGGLFTVCYEKGSGAIYVNLLSGEEKNRLVTEALTAAAGYPCRFRAVIEGAQPDRSEAAQEAEREAKRQAESNLAQLSDMFDRENVRVLDD